MHKKLGKSQIESKTTLKKEQVRRWFSMPSYDLGRDYDEPTQNNQTKHPNPSGILKHQKKIVQENTVQPKISDVIDLSKYTNESQEGFPYIQMKLDSNIITEDFRKSIQKRIANQVKIREATKEDIPKLVSLYNRSFLSANDPYVPMNEENMSKVFEYNNTVILIGTIWGKDAGFVIIDIDTIDEKYKKDEKSDTYKIGFISGMGTLPEWRRRGVGSSLGILSYNFIFKKIPSLKELRCEVYSKNLPSYNLIKGMGFSVDGVKYYKF